MTKILKTLEFPDPSFYLKHLNSGIHITSGLLLKVAEGALVLGSKKLKEEMTNKVEKIEKSVFNYAIVKFSPAFPFTVSATTGAQSTAASTNSSCHDVVYYQVACLAALMIMFLMQAGIAYKRGQLKKDSTIAKGKLAYITSMHRTNKFLQKSEALAQACLTSNENDLGAAMANFQAELPKMINKGGVPDRLRIKLHKAKERHKHQPDQLADFVNKKVLPLIDFYSEHLKVKMEKEGYVFPEQPLSETESLEDETPSPIGLEIIDESDND